MSDVVPVVIATYVRLNHLKCLIDSLAKNNLARDTDLWIYSDAASNYEDIEQVNAIRSYLKKVSGFKNVKVVYRERNYGAFNNMRLAYMEVGEIYGRCIVMEDDLELSPDYLKYMNWAMNFYETNQKIIGVSAYIRPEVEAVTEGIFFMRKRSPYGSGVWYSKERRIRAELDRNVCQEYLENFDLFKKYEPLSVNTRSLPLIHRRDLVLGDIETAMLMFKNDLLSVYPPVSLVTNKGNDGTGLHAGRNLLLQSQKYGVLPKDFFDMDLKDIQIINDQKLEHLHVSVKRIQGESVLNYAIYFLYKYMPFLYEPFKRARGFYKNIKLLIAVKF